jgi:hypothetical protein
MNCRKLILLETSQTVRIEGNSHRWDFVCHITTKEGILRSMDFAHPVTTKFFHDAVVGDDFAKHGWKAALGDAY